MRTIEANVATTANNLEMFLWPNGCRNSTGGADRDVFMGSCLLNEVRMLVVGTPVATTFTMYEGLLDVTVPPYGNVMVGGTPAQRHRITVGTTGTMGAMIAGLVDPTMVFAGASALGTNVLDMRTRGVVTITPVTGQWMRLPFQGIEFPIGCMLRLSAGSSTATYTFMADFVPHVSGAYRKKLAGVAPLQGQITHEIHV